MEMRPQPFPVAKLLVEHGGQSTFNWKFNALLQSVQVDNNGYLGYLQSDILLIFIT